MGNNLLDAAKAAVSTMDQLWRDKTIETSDMLNAATDLRAAIADAEKAPEQEPVVIYRGRRLTPEGTKEVWGELTGEDLPRGTLLYRHPAPLRELIGTIEMLCDGLEWNIENHPDVMNDSDSEALAKARAIIAAAVKDKVT